MCFHSLTGFAVVWIFFDVGRKHWQKLLSTYKGIAVSKVLEKKAASFAEKMEEVAALSQSATDLSKCKEILQSEANSFAVLSEELKKLTNELGGTGLKTLQSGIAKVHKWAHETLCPEWLFSSIFDELAEVGDRTLLIPEKTSSAETVKTFNNGVIALPSMPESVDQAFLLRCCST
jgi:hypothetical protein